MEFHPFYVGQKVVAIENFKIFNKGEEFTVTSTSFCPNCNEPQITIGIPKQNQEIVNYTKCSKKHKNNTNEWLVRAKRFKPLEENFESISLSKILDLETSLISIN